MDIIHIGRRHYRKNPTWHNEAGHHRDNAEQQQSTSLDDVADQLHRTTIHVPVAFHPLLLANKSELQAKHRCRISILPSDDSSSPHISVEASSVNHLQDVVDSIDFLIATKRQSTSRPTHFLCLPCWQSVELQDNFERFKRILLDRDYPGININHFQSPDRLHLTLATLILADQSEVDMACQLLIEFESDQKSLFRGGLLELGIKGLESMTDDYSNTSILYAKVNPESRDAKRLQTLADSITDLFATKSSLSNRQHFRVDNRVKLHMTLMNAKFAANRHDGEAAETFDATNVMRDCRDYEFAPLTTRFSNLFLCPLSSNFSNKDPVSSSAHSTSSYQCCFSLNLAKKK